MVLSQVILTFGHPLHQADIQSDVASSRGIWWLRIEKCKVILTFGHPVGQADIQSNILPL